MKKKKKEKSFNQGRCVDFFWERKEKITLRGGLISLKREERKKAGRNEGETLFNGRLMRQGNRSKASNTESDQETQREREKRREERMEPRQLASGARRITLVRV